PDNNWRLPHPARGARDETLLPLIPTALSPQQDGVSCVLRFVQLGSLPEHSIVERTGQAKQAVAHRIEEEPGDHHPGQHLHGANNPEEPAAPSEWRRRQFLQATGADHAVIMLCDAFATKATTAFRALRHGFAHGMVEATLVAQVAHEVEPTQFSENE